MRRIFRAHYHLPKEELEELWREGLIIPDASVLLSLYRYSPSTRSALLKLLASLRARVWLPHQAGLEFLRNRPHVIIEQRDAYEPLLGEFQKFLKALENTRGHPFVSPQLSKELNRIYEGVKKEFTQSAGELEALREKDMLLDEVTRLFEGHVGASCSKEEQDKLKEEGRSRYKDRVPPGFADESKPDHTKYGDFIIWKQILGEAKVQKKGAIFINDDLKDDWWIKVKGGEAIGPLPALREEFSKETGKAFFMYPSEKFLELAGKMLNQPVPKEAIKEVKETRVARSIADAASLQFARALADFERTRAAAQATAWEGMVAERLKTAAALERTLIDDVSLRATLAAQTELDEQIRNRMAVLNALRVSATPEAMKGAKDSQEERRKGEGPPAQEPPSS